MDLQRCRHCKNQIAAQTVLCPICGRHPTHRPLKKTLLLTTALLLTAFAALRLRPHFTHPSVPPAVSHL